MNKQTSKVKYYSRGVPVIFTGEGVYANVSHREEFMYMRLTSITDVEYFMSHGLTVIYLTAADLTVEEIK